MFWDTLDLDFFTLNVKMPFNSLLVRNISQTGQIILEWTYFGFESLFCFKGQFIFIKGAQICYQLPSNPLLSLSAFKTVGTRKLVRE